MQPLVSILLPVYNGLPFIKESVESILNQTYSNFELIIIDDYSTDETAKFIKTNFEDSRIKLIENETNLGIAKTLNKGIDLAAGKYIARMDHDDISVPERLEVQVNFLEQNLDISICGSWIETFGADKNIIRYAVKHKDIKDGMMEGSSVCHPAVMMRKEFVKEHSFYYDPEKVPSEDYDLFFRMIEKGKFENIPQILLKYRISGNQASFRKSEDNKIARNTKQINTSSAIRRKIFTRFLPSDHELYEEKWVELFLNQRLIEKFEEITLFHLWMKKLIKYNEEIGKPHNSHFLKGIGERRILGYFLTQEKLSWKILFQYLSAYNKSSRLERKKEIKYILKCLSFRRF